MLNYKQALAKAARETLTTLVHPDAWLELGVALKDGGIAVLFLVVRVILFLTFPVSIPLVALLIKWDENKREIQRVEVTSRLQRGIHQNGPGA